MCYLDSSSSKQKKSSAKMSWVNPKWMEAAIIEAKQGLAEGGLPIGSVLVDPLSGVEGIKTARVIQKIKVNNLEEWQNEF